MNKLIRATAADPSLSKGDWRTYSPDGNSKFRVKLLPGGSHNDALQKKAQELTKAYTRSGLRLDELPPKTQKEITAKLYSQTIIADWNSDDFEEAFSAEAAERTLLASQEFADWVRDESQDYASFRSREIKEVSGNSQEPSDTV